MNINYARSDTDKREESMFDMLREYGYSSDYYDIDDILSESMPINCKFESDVYDANYLLTQEQRMQQEQQMISMSANNTNKNAIRRNVVKAGTEFSLPYFLARPLSLHSFSMVDPSNYNHPIISPYLTLYLPSLWQRHSINSLNASPVDANFSFDNRKYFYEIGTKLLFFSIPTLNDLYSADLISELMHSTLEARLLNVVSQWSTVKSAYKKAEKDDFVHRLSHLERNLLLRKLFGLLEIEKFKKRLNEIIQPSNIITQTIEYDNASNNSNTSNNANNSNSGNKRKFRV